MILTERFWLLSLFVVLGAFASLLLNINEAAAKHNFSWKIFVKQNWLSTLTNITVGIIIVASTYDETTVFTMTKLMAFSLGAIAQQFFRKLCNIFLRFKPTYIGWNDNYGQSNDDDEEVLDP